MEGPIVVCSSAKQAAQFCFEQKKLQKPVKERRGVKHQPKQNSKPVSTGRVEKQHRQPHNSFKAHRGPVDLEIPYFHGYALFGDSILKRMARSEGSFVSKHSSTCFGGATISTLLDVINKIEVMPKRVIFLIGANDLMKGKSKANILHGIETLLRVSIDKKTEEVKLCTLLPTVASTRSTDLEFINAEIQHMGSQDTSIINIHNLFYDANKKIQLDYFERFYKDGRWDLIHPNEAGLKKIAAALQQESDDTESVYMDLD